jgi:hypothetical protein
MPDQATPALLPRGPLVPARWAPHAQKVQRALVVGLAGVSIVFFTWMFWWRFVTYDDYLLAHTDCPLGSFPSLTTETRRVRQPHTTNYILITTTRAECVLIPDPSRVRP